MSELPPPRFRKTKSDKWAVMAPVETLEAAFAADGKVEVLKRSGDTSTFVVASLGKPFDVDGVQMCYGYGPDEDEGSAGGDGGRQAERGRRSDGGTSSSPSTPARSGPSAARAALAKAIEPPLPDPSEPLPEWQGGAEDEWRDEF